MEAKVRYLVYREESRESGNKRERRQRREVCSREDGMVHQESEVTVIFYEAG